MANTLLHQAALLHLRVAALVAHFQRVQAQRMVGIPLLNPALRVEAVGFEWAQTTHGPLADVAEGVLVTPWFMSLVRLPAPPLPHGNQVGCRVVRDFGTERFDFLGAHDPSVGYHETCALFSPMNGFSSHELARDTALASLALLRPDAQTAEGDGAGVGAGRVAGAAPVQANTMPTRRAFFLARGPARGAQA